MVLDIEEGSVLSNVLKTNIFILITMKAQAFCRAMKENN